MALPTVSPSISSGDGNDRVEEVHMNSPPLIEPIQLFIHDIIQFIDIRNVIISYDTKHIVPEEPVSDVRNNNTSMNSEVDELGSCNEKEIAQENLKSNVIQSKM